MRRLPPEVMRKVQAVIELLADTPRPPASRKLTARKEWRVRTGDYRIIYRIEDEILVIVIVAVGHRGDIYRKAFRRS